MKKVLVILFAFSASIELLSAQQEQNQAKTVQISQSELLSSKDLKPLLAIAYPKKDFSLYRINGFKLSGSYTGKDNTGNIVSMSFAETSVCGTLTENQRVPIKKYGINGMVFTIEDISITELGKPGTPYHPEEEVSITVPNFSFTIKE